MYIQDMKTQVARWGNSLGLRIPKSVAADANVSEGDEVEVTVESGAIVVRAAPRRYTLEELLDGLPAGTKPELIDWGPPVGKEEW